MWLTISLVGLAFAVLAALRKYYDPVIPGELYKNAVPLRVFHLFANISHWWCVFRCLFGGNYSGHLRGLQDFVTRIAPKTPPLKITKSLRIETTNVAGVQVRIYSPLEKISQSRPGVIFYHGGGWAIGNLDGYDAICGKIAKSVGAVVVSVDYKLAHMKRGIKFPGPLDDCVLVTKEIMNAAGDYGVDLTRIALAGDSAGGNLAAAVCLRLRDEKFEHSPKLQILIYPALQFINFQLPSYQQNAFGPILYSKGCAMFTALYAIGDENYYQDAMENSYIPDKYRRIFDTSNLDKELCLRRPYNEPRRSSSWAGRLARFEDVICNPYVSPLLADDLSRLPRAYIFSAQYDVLRDDAFLFEKRLRESGVPVTHNHSKLGFHGIISVYMTMKEARTCMEEIIEFIKDNL